MKQAERSWLRPALAGAAAGVVNGFFGGGGGMVLVPLLAGWCGLGQRKAFATSVAIILPLCVLSAAIYLFRGGVDFTAALPYLAGGLLGGLLGGRLFKGLNMTWLRRGFALLILYGGVRALLG
ncbi:TSUP family transporter [Pseudoflavonifractor phocaeensis]|uniref:TSUP family transporter n=1 Tax=Pseudoflavonifractor phocaeensis TaxID=1870988 RepID=UPI00195ED319|nr:TSUP family transporter [Pseudoflavonifractor phocaeensis]MBM6925796.1 TSUP family transporter [Pseudoflavonifractor phocaeensis]